MEDPFFVSFFRIFSTFPTNLLIQRQLGQNISAWIVLNFGRSGGVMEKLRPTSVISFGAYEINLRSGELRKSGVKIKLQPQPFKLLEILLERPGQVVTREELRSQIWPKESFGDFDQAVNIAIAKLRVALADSADNPRYIETIPRRGYRFIGQVAGLPDDFGRASFATSPSELARISPGTASETPKPLVASRLLLVLALSFCLAAILGYLAWRWRNHSRATAPPDSPIQSLAVLPLENLSGDAQDYFADGMTDELITDLAQIGALRVISRTSVMPYKNVREPLPVIARALNVDAIVEGTVLRSGNRVRITAQLVLASADKHLWAKSYEGDLGDTLSLQKQVANAIADQIRIELTPREQSVLQKVASVNPEAYDDYLKGRFFLNKRNSNEKAQAYFQLAIGKDPSYAPPYAGLADIYLLADNPRQARESLEKALILDNQLAEAHNSLAQLLYHFDHDWVASENEFKRALDLDANYAPAHHWYSMYLALIGRKTQALDEARKAYQLDPLSPVVGANLAKILQENAQYEEAIEQAKRTLELEPNSAVTHAVLGIVHEDQKMYAEAIAEYKSALELGGAPGEMRGLLGYIYAITGDQRNAKIMINELKQLWPTHAHAALDLAIVYCGLGQKDQALDWLKKASDANVGDLIVISHDRHFDSLRSDDRFRALIKQVGSLP
jgi:TolB-like protein/DNA-binding winged helix-turn-helix (wHTH) protein/Flp pilus assembly protein TadD